LFSCHKHEHKLHIDDAISGSSYFVARQHAMHAERGIVIANPSVRLSVHLSV